MSSICRYYLRIEEKEDLDRCKTCKKELKCAQWATSRFIKNMKQHKNYYEEYLILQSDRAQTASSKRKPDKENCEKPLKQLKLYLTTTVSKDRQK